MKRIITLAGILFILIPCLKQNGFAQTITRASQYDSCTSTASNVIQSYLYFSGPTGFSAGSKLETNHGDGSKKDTSVISGAGTSAVSSVQHSYSAPGTYTVKYVLIYLGVRVDSINASVSVACTYIGGSLYNDANTNCVFNTGELTMNSLSLIEVDSAGVKIDTVYAWGTWMYGIKATAATTYKFKLLNTPTGYVKSCPTSGVITYSYLPTLSPITGQDFGFNCTPPTSYDYSLSFARALRGASSTGSSYIYLFAANSSCYSGTGSVTLQVSPKYTITSSGITPTPASVSGNTVTWTITGMANGAQTYLYVPLTPKSTTSNGDTACNYAIITTTGDADLSNNTVNICDSVRASWDPNEKSVSPRGPVSAGTMLTYTIDFENLGNDTAFNIHVQDTLSQHLDVNTFKLLSATHKVIPYLYEIPGGRRIIKFDFPNINLQDKRFPMRNKGQVRFTIRMKTGLPVGTEVPNRAGIYFDGNPVVLTNYAYSKIPVPSGVEHTAANSDLSVFPNPAHDVLTLDVSNGQWQEATLSNALGQVVAHMPLTTGKNKMGIQDLPAGIYYLQAKGTAGTVTEKIQKY